MVSLILCCRRLPIQLVSVFVQLPSACICTKVGKLSESSTFAIMPIESVRIELSAMWRNLSCRCANRLILASAVGRQSRSYFWYSYLHLFRFYRSISFSYIYIIYLLRAKKTIVKSEGRRPFLFSIDFRLPHHVRALPFFSP